MELRASLLDGKKINKVIKDVFNKKIAKGEIPKELFNETNKQYFDAIDEGIGEIAYGNPDYGFMHELKTNATVYSAFKNHAQSLEMFDALTDEDGNVRSFDKFKKAALAIDKQYHQTWLNTEYNYAVRASRSASQWRQFKRDADLYPNLEYMPSLSSNPREGHKQYYGVVKPINDPFWDNMLPPNGWGCKCSVQQTRAEADVTEYEPIDSVDGIPGNAGKAEMLWTPDSPFVKNLSAAQRKAVKEQYDKLIDNEFDYDIEKVGKNKVWIHKKAHHQDVVENVRLAKLLSKRYKFDLEILDHEENTARTNPEYKNITDGHIGDRVNYTKKNTLGKFFIRRIDNKYGRHKRKNGTYKDGQLRNFKDTFMVFDLENSLTEENIESSLEILQNRMYNRSNMKYAVLVQGDKTVILDRKMDVNEMLVNTKEQLLK